MFAAHTAGGGFMRTAFHLQEALSTLAVSYKYFSQINYELSRAIKRFV